MLQMPNQKLVAFAKIGRPHGLRGELRLFPYNAESPNLSRIRTAILVLDEARLQVRVTQLRGSTDAFIIRCSEISSREQAAAWTNAILHVDESLFPPIEEEDTYYYWQLEGLRAVGFDGVEIGTIRTVLSHGAGELIVVDTTRGSLDIPFADPWVGEVNITEGFVQVDPNWLGDED